MHSQLFVEKKSCLVGWGRITFNMYQGKVMHSNKKGIIDRKSCHYLLPYCTIVNKNKTPLFEIIFIQYKFSFSFIPVMSQNFGCVTRLYMYM